MANIKLLLVDDHGPLRKALHEGLQATGVVQVVGEVSTGREAVARALELDMDVILMDVQLQDTQSKRNALSGVGAAHRDRPFASLRVTKLYRWWLIKIIIMPVRTILFHFYLVSPRRT
jgi:DNA-binding NarL/FixJ family response regulator